MVVRVRLEGLKIVKARGRWYDYVRDGMDALRREGKDRITRCNMKGRATESADLSWSRFG
jgi:hypothetical protein